MIVTARLTFSAAHRLNNPKYDAEWNRRTYDKCDNAAGHGHNYALEVSVRGKIDPETGMVIDLKKLKDIVRSKCQSDTPVHLVERIRFALRIERHET